VKNRGSLRERSESKKKGLLKEGKLSAAIVVRCTNQRMAVKNICRTQKVEKRGRKPKKSKGSGGGEGRDTCPIG